MQKNDRRNIRLIINLIIIAALAIVTYFGTRPPHVEVSRSSVKISGLYGVELRMQDIEKLELRESLPQIRTRINGMDLFGFARRGIYDLEELGRTRLISFSNGGPFILIRTGNEWIVMNFKNPNDTEALYQSIEEAFNQR
ncbi:MAG TPA: hypothetical protein GX505_01505 [Clostridiales bacterium]|nr:hypothetical protein [Clostridiales bacterium]